MRRCAHGRGFSLLEVLIALAVLGLAITSMVTLLSRHAFLERHLDGHLQALRVLEAQHEAWRGGLALPPDGGTHTIDPVIGFAAPVDELVLRARVEALQPRGYFGVTLTADYRIGGARFSRSLEARFWRP